MSHTMTEQLKPVACVDSGVLNWIADRQISGPSDLFAIPPTHRVVSVELLDEMRSLISSGKYNDDTYIKLRAIIDNKEQK